MVTVEGQKMGLRTDTENGHGGRANAGYNIVTMYSL